MEGRSNRILYLIQLVHDLSMYICQSIVSIKTRHWVRTVIDVRVRSRYPPDNTFLSDASHESRLMALQKHRAKVRESNTTACFYQLRHCIYHKPKFVSRR